MPSDVTPEMFAAWELSRDPRQVGYAREATHKTLASWGLSEHVELLELIVSELVTNAIVYGTEPIELRLTRKGDWLRVEVHDNGDGRPTQCHPTEDDECGRGLALVASLVNAHLGTHGVTEDGGPGKTVHASVPLTDANPSI